MKLPKFSPTPTTFSRISRHYLRLYNGKNCTIGTLTDYSNVSKNKILPHVIVWICIFMCKQQENIKLNFLKPDVCNIKAENALGLGTIWLGELN